MSKNFAELAQAVVDALGGKNNIIAVTHCMTRLRFVLKDESKVDGATLKSINGVMGVVRNDNQCQVIIGNTVAQAYREVTALLPAGQQPEEVKGPQKMTLRRIGAGILDALIGTMSPLIPAIIGGSMIKLLAMLCRGACFPASRPAHHGVLQFIRTYPSATQSINRDAFQ